VRCVLSLVFLLHVLASSALAQTPRQSAEPSEALRLAIAAYDAGDWSEAQRRFEAAHNEAPTARTLRGLGVVAYRQGRQVDAYAYLTRSLVSNAKPLTEELRASVLTLLNELAAGLTRVHFQLYPPGAELRIDGAVPTYDASGAALVTPGTHRASLAAPGYVSSEWLLEAQAGLEQLRSWQLALAATPQPASGPVAPTRAPASRGASGVNTRATEDGAQRAMRLRRWGYGTLAGTAAALVTVAVAVGLGVDRVQEIESRCKKRPEGGCTRSEADREAREKNLPLLSGLAISGGALAGVGAVATTWLFVAAHRADAASPAPAGITLSVRSTF
jgi:hypothetical protein